MKFKTIITHKLNESNNYEFYFRTDKETIPTIAKTSKQLRQKIMNIVRYHPPMIDHYSEVKLVLPDGHVMYFDRIRDALDNLETL